MISGFQPAERQAVKLKFKVTGKESAAESDGGKIKINSQTQILQFISLGLLLS